MAGIFKGLSLVSRGLRYKLIVVFCLMSVIPLLTFTVILTYYFMPTVTTLADVVMIIIIAVVIAVMGLYLAWKMIAPIIDMAADARIMARGDITRKIAVREENEIGELGDSLNIMADRLKENMSELQNYSTKIEEINAEINKKILALTNLYHVGNTMTTSAELENILQFVLEKIMQTINVDKSFLALYNDETKKFDIAAVQNMDAVGLKKIADEIAGEVFKKIISQNEPTIIDTGRKPSLGMKGFLFLSEYGIKNAVMAPIFSRGAGIGVIGIGNELSDFQFEEDDLKILNIFIKQIAIAIDNDKLLRKTKKLTNKDELTGLYNIQYINERLEEEIRRSVTYQRPCSLVMIALNNYQGLLAGEGRPSMEEAIKKLASIIKQNTGLLDKVARFREAEFAIVMPEKSKAEAQDIAEKIKSGADTQNLSAGKSKVSISAGVSSIPIDGVSADELINRAFEGVKSYGDNS